MVILNQNVKHSIFGVGVITGVKDHRISVKFKENIGTKIFLYPEAFPKYLMAVNETVENYLQEELSIKQEKIRLEREEKEREAAELEEKIEKISVGKKKSETGSKKKKS
ncbi:hypothetical protein [Clostridium sp. Marseille-Q2269]|uniref:hypothetical protein n=1 Tax=Clostridium sp. Marseille-Q2269 TaxID=2942205 RepID=UPI002073D6BD|nr:hypothetical protein [Clostridium sp. Marseille-Q2269]